MFNGTFKPVNEHWNAYYNPNKANPDWGRELIGAKMVGRHRVGELAWITRSVKNQGIAKVHKPTGTYTVKAGDNLWKIAKANNTTVQRLKQANKLGSDAIRPGMVLNLA
jgi:LysM repeat protein